MLGVNVEVTWHNLNTVTQKGDLKRSLKPHFDVNV